MATAVKKKAVYVRGPNNIYRRKSYSGSISSEESQDLARQKESVDSALNDLMVCGFSVSTPASPPKTKRGGTKTKLTAAHAPEFLPSSAPASTSNPVSPLRTEIPKDAFEKLQKPWMPSLEHVQSYLSVSQARSALPYAAVYVSGVASTMLVQRNWVWIASYAKFLTNLLIMGVIWAVLAAAAFWYAGVLKMSSVSGLFSSFSGETAPKAAPKPSGSPLNYSYDLRGRMGRRLDDTDADSVLSSGSDTDPKMKLKTASEPYLVRDTSPSKLVNVRPFIPPRRDSAESKASQPQPHLNRFHTSDGLGFPKKSRFRFHSPEREKQDDPRRHSSASLEIQKPLPPVSKLTRKAPDSELPLVHEVKLKSRFDKQLEELQFEAARLGRSDTLLSKQSIMGTRANRRTFLSNVDES